MAGYEERLIEQFLDWAALGSGRLPPWPVPVVPEPPYRPFTRYTMRWPEPVDDGRRPTGLSSFLDAVRTSPRSPPRPAPEDENGFETPPEELFDDRSEIVELQLLPPAGCEISGAALEYFFYSLSSAQFPLCFEMIAQPGGLVLQLCCDHSDATLVSQCIEAHLPELGVSRKESFLLDLVLEKPEHYIASADLALSSTCLIPIRGLKSFARDPYQGILSSMAGLDEGEFAIVQINFQACARDWAAGMWNLVTPDGGPAIPTAEVKDLLEGVRAKTHKPLFAAQVRLTVLSDCSERAAAIGCRIADSFGLYTERNGFGFTDGAEQTAIDRKMDLALRRFRLSGMILNAEELCSLVHIPGKDVHAPQLARLTERTTPAPAYGANQGDLTLGLNLHRGQQREVHLTVDERTKHMHVIGASGTGKSTFLLNCILQDIRQGHGCALLDPHGDLVEGVLRHLPRERAEDVILFDPADEEFPVGFNMLSAGSDIEKNLLASDFVSIFQRLSASWGDQMTAVLANATLAILESTSGGTLLDLRRLLVERTFRNQFLKTVQDPEVRYFWQHEFPMLKGNPQASLLTRLNSFIRQKLIRNMIAQDGNKLDFAKIMDGSKIFLAPLPQGLIGEENSWLLGSLLVSKFYQIALARQTQAESARQPFFLYIDEAHNFITESIASILSGTRKYGLGLVLAHQELGQFGRGESNILSSILTNSHTRVCFHVGDQDARKLQEGFEHFGAEDLRQLGIGRAICRIGGSDRDFNLLAPSPPEEANDPDVADAVRSHSRAHYAIHRDEVEAIVNAQATAREEAHRLEAAERRTKTKTASRSAPAPEPSPATVPADPFASPTSKSTNVPQSAPPPISDEPSPPPPSTAEESTSARETSGPPTPPPEETPPKPPPKALPAAAHFKKGWGGPKHKALQEQIKQHANGLGFRATIEAALPDNRGSVDVLLETQSQQIAIEVALKSPIDQEIRNIAKALESEFSKVVVVSDSAAHLASIREAAEGANLESLGERVSFIHRDEIGEFLNSMRASIPPSEMSSLGYTVKTKYNKLSEAELRARKDSVHRTLSEAERRLERQQDDQREGGSEQAG